MKQYLQTHSRLVKIVLWLFATGIIAGAATAFFYPELMEEIVASFDERFGEMPALDYNLAKEIFIQNLTVSIVAWLGALFLGLTPLFVVTVNGFILGYVVAYYLIYFGFTIQNSLFLAATLVPHGILELPAFLVAAVLGLRLGWGWLGIDAQGNRWGTFKLTIKETTMYFSFVVLALIAAAFIEVFISGQIVSNY